MDYRIKYLQKRFPRLEYYGTIQIVGKSDLRRIAETVLKARKYFTNREPHRWAEYDEIGIDPAPLWNCPRFCWTELGDGYMAFISRNRIAFRRENFSSESA